MLSNYQDAKERAFNRKYQNSLLLSAIVQPLRTINTVWGKNCTDKKENLILTIAIGWKKNKSIARLAQCRSSFPLERNRFAWLAFKWAVGGSTKQTTASATSKMSKLNSKLFKGKMVESMRKSTENLSGLLENNVTSSPTGDDPLAAGLELNPHSAKDF